MRGNQQSYSQDVLNLVLVNGCLAKLMVNEAVLRYLTKHHNDMFNEFDRIVRMKNLDK